MAEKRWVFLFVTGTVSSHLFVTGQIGMKFGQKTSTDVLCRTLIEEFRLLSLKEVILSQNRYFRLLRRVSMSQAYRLGVAFLT